jgi:hypothetical protein
LGLDLNTLDPNIYKSASELLDDFFPHLTQRYPDFHNITSNRKDSKRFLAFICDKIGTSQVWQLNFVEKENAELKEIELELKHTGTKFCWVLLKQFKGVINDVKSYGKEKVIDDSKFSTSFAPTDVINWINNLNDFPNYRLSNNASLDVRRMT